MKCPYCLSEVEDEALVCKVCTRDIHLFKPLLARIEALEAQIRQQEEPNPHEARAQELERQLAEALERLHPPRHWALTLLINVAGYILLPLALLLLAHGLITIVLDAHLIYLRAISIALPLPFGLLLFSRRQRAVLPWFAGTVVLAVASVIGMSWITSLVDHTPVLPQNALEWREYLEYSASIAFSFLTGMLLGGLLHAHRNRRTGAPGITKTSVLRAIVSRLAGGRLTPQQLGELIQKVEEYSSSAVAVGSTAMSIYTGLKGVLGGS